ncbi:flavin-dependent oxidoreductase [Pusillimonas noertemannii]|uniref:2-polyprenyl-6-methoxyphenol hydroxylase-like FAD-dependent oxidoreductase n=1 Tax=Pusillimonas noertemannii TaxID=305977 RepID=A0A2U1CJM4_9BURK|nr:flavin-dependent oxidoreductase [Pusillimonas noertemannii]NYT69875.1 flavin-dependent oxidoreductase [Pusillimonas noertemannii]PVY61201.1 2-polyprenyl-6-methoxyphenol hydroxylase-like FAD-dependent oxidoreductase [Pusillimonas noertemannii]TFL09173.1 flavin-dependent oxidoreductase [Pusillimonas noertemannii]
MSLNHDVVIVGAGIGGLTLALELHKAGFSCRLYEAVEQIKPLGAGINVLPHAVKVLDDLGLLPELEAIGVTTKESVFYNKFGQFVYREPAGIDAGYGWPQFSIHRGDLQSVLIKAVQQRLGADAIVLGHRCTGATQTDADVSVQFERPDGSSLSVQGALVIGCDGIHSAIRKQLYPNEGAPRYSGVNMWRGTTTMKPFLSSASMTRVGWLSVGKMVIYPIRNNIDGQGTQLVNWVAELETPFPAKRDWTRNGRLEDFFPAFADWHFDWLDVAGMIEKTDNILEYPMVDQDPLPRWSFGRISLLGDAAHPMVPRGSNGAGQAILDAPSLTMQLKTHGLTDKALTQYDRIRVKATTEVVLMNRVAPPDTILKEVHDRTGGKPFQNLDDFISRDELIEISNNYKNVAGFKVEDLRKPEAI